jgi:hypothetical protein
MKNVTERTGDAAAQEKCLAIKQKLLHASSEKKSFLKIFCLPWPQLFIGDVCCASRVFRKMVQMTRGHQKS